jgi:hypothetical protein
MLRVAIDGVDGWSQSVGGVDRLSQSVYRWSQSIDHLLYIGS